MQNRERAKNKTMYTAARPLHPCWNEQIPIKKITQKECKHLRTSQEKFLCQSTSESVFGLLGSISFHWGVDPCMLYTYSLVPVLYNKYNSDAWDFEIPNQAVI